MAKPRRGAYIGDLPQGAVVATLGALGSAQITGGEAPTEAEYNALQTDVANVRTRLNDLITSLRNAGLIAAP